MDLNLSCNSLFILMGNLGTLFLLHHMRQFMSQQLFPLICSWLILSSTKHHVLPRRISQRIHRLRRLSRPPIRVHSHPAKIMPKSWLHKGACTLIERLAPATTQHLVDERRGAGCFMYRGVTRLFTCKKIIGTQPGIL